MLRKVWSGYDRFSTTASNGDGRRRKSVDYPRFELGCSIDVNRRQGCRAARIDDGGGFDGGDESSEREQDDRKVHFS